MPSKVYLRKVRINNGGYTDKGYYYGVGAPVYEAHCDDWDYSKSVRAHNREDAKAQIRYMCPGQTLSFYR